MHNTLIWRSRPRVQRTYQLIILKTYPQILSDTFWFIMFSSKLNLSLLFRKEQTTVQLSTTKMFLLKVTYKMSHPTINFWFGIEVVDVEKICPPVLVTKWFFLYYKPSRTLAEKFTYFNVKKQHKHVGWSQPARKIISTSLNIREGGSF